MSSIGSQHDTQPDSSLHDVSGCLDYLLATFTASSGRVSSPAFRPHIDLDLTSIEIQLLTVIKHVRILRNAELPVMRLPPEVLELVFSMVQSPMDYDKIPSRKSRRYLAWMRIMRVCQHWHDVATSCASLWTNIVLESGSKQNAASRRSLSRLFLRNSGQAFLNVHLLFFDRLQNCRIQDVLPHLPRIQELHLSKLSPPLTQDRIALLQVPAPRLQTLVVQAPCSAGSVHLPALFGGSLPALQFLSISSFTVYAKDNFRNLRQLHLIKQEYSSADRIQSLLDLLDGSPSLEDLMLSSIHFHHDLHGVVPVARSHHCQLSKLKRLSFDQVDSCCVAQMLSHLHLPKGLLLHLERQHFTRSDYLLPADISYLSNLEAINRIQLRFKPASFYAVTMFAAGDTSAFGIDTAIYNVAQVTSTMARILQGVSELWVIGARDFREQHTCFKRIFHSASALKKLILEISETMRPQCAEQVFPQLASEDTDVPCPLLDELHILKPGLRVFELTQQFLQTREARGHRLRSLHIYLPLSGYPDDVLSKAKSVFEEWEHLASVTLRPHVDYLEFIRTQELPRMHIPPTCTAQNTGRWSRPTPWVEAFPPGSPSLSEGLGVAY